MAVNIGPQIGIDGEKEYRKSINDLITQQKTFSAEMRELESSFNDSGSAMDKNRRKGELLEKSIKNQEKTVEELEKGLAASTEKYGENATQTQKWKQAVSNAKTELNKMRTELNKVPKSLTTVGQSLQSAGKKMQSVGDTMSKYVTAPLVGIGVASVAAFKEVDEGMDIIATKTGAAGQALTDMEDSAKNIATTIPTSFETAGTAIGEVNTRFGVTGTELEDLSTKFIKFADLNDTDVASSVDGVQKVMAAFGVETKDAGKLLDAMNKTGQKTGISMDTLQSSMVKNAAALQDMGLDAYDAAMFLGEVETSGADTSMVMSGLSKALTNAADDGKTLPEALGDFQSVMNSTASDQEKLNAAVDLFGKKAGPAIYEACKSGSLSFESLSNDASEYLGSVETTFDNMLDPADEFTTTMNSLKVLGSEVGEALLTAAVPALESIGTKLKNAADWFSDLDEDQKTFATNIGISLAVGGPVLSAVGRLTSGIGGVVTAIDKWTGIPAMIGTVLTNPVLAAGLAVGGLAVAFNLLDKDVGYMNESVQTVVTNTNSAITAMDTATSSLSSTLSDAEEELSDINGKADLASDLIDELADLESQTSLTAEEQGRMRTIVGELNGLYPELGLQIDSSTGKLNKSTAEIKKYVEQTRKMKLIEAYQKAASKGYEDLAETSIALADAQQQESDNLETLNGLYEEQARLNGLVDDGNGNLVDSTGEFVMASNALDQALLDVANDIMVTEEKQGELTTATENAQTAYDNAEEQISGYEQAALDTAAELETLTGATETNTETTDANTESVEANAEATNSWASNLAQNAVDAATGLLNTASAWNELYTATKESIDGQMGLFDEWEQDSEVTIDSMIENLQSQISGMRGYATNMKTLSAAAAKSSDPNFKAVVKSIAEMGVDGAAYAQALVDAMNTDQEKFNEYLSMVGGEGSREEVQSNLAGVLSYVQNDFSTGMGTGLDTVKTAFDSVFGEGKVQTMMAGFGQKILETMNTTDKFGQNVESTAKKVNTAVNNSGKNLTNTAKSSTDTATNYTETEINGMTLEPAVQKVDVPGQVTSDAKNKVNAGLYGTHSWLSKILNVGEAAKTAKATAEGKLDSMSGKVTKVSVSNDALSGVRTTISTFLSNNPITTFIKGVVQATHHAEGGFTYHQQLSWLSEGNQPEVVIPLAAAHRTEAMRLYQQTGEKLGIAQTNVTTMSMASPNRTNGVKVSFDTERLYAACASGAKAGMENANVSIYIGEREAGRILKGMGVQFA